MISYLSMADSVDTSQSKETMVYSRLVILRSGLGILPSVFFLLILFLAVSLSAQDEDQASASATQTAQGMIEGSINPDSYIVGPGDLLEIGIWGGLGRRYTVPVNPEGTVTIHPVGPIKVDGMVLSEVNRTIIDQLSKYYRRDIITVSLVGVRTFTIHVIGWVESPGAVSANAVTRVSQALRLAGWVRAGGSLRNIVLMRGDKRIPVDISRYLLIGDTSRNPFVTGGDIVYVPAVSGQVSILGEVNSPGSYEFVEGETLGDLVELAGGFKISAWLDTIEVQRFSDDNPTMSIAIYLNGDAAVIDSFKLKIGDRFFVRSIPEFHDDPRVEIVGEVRYPGIYVIEEGIETITDLIKRAGGFTDRASLAEARLIRGIYQARSFPVESEVGVYKDLQDGLTGRERDLLGVLSREPKGRIVVDLEKTFASGDPRFDIKLCRSDRIEIPRVSNLVRVSGQVETPGLLSFRKGFRFRDYIELAGGYASGADKRATRVIRATGGQQVKPGSVEIQPGDIIWVPRKPERSGWEIAKDVINVVTQLATIYLVVDAIAKK
ncbi:MAG: SLBB domain-containing protein [bacterium]